MRHLKLMSTILKNAKAPPPQAAQIIQGAIGLWYRALERRGMAPPGGADGGGKADLVKAMLQAARASGSALGGALSGGGDRTPDQPQGGADRAVWKAFSPDKKQVFAAFNAPAQQREKEEKANADFEAAFSQATRGGRVGRVVH